MDSTVAMTVDRTAGDARRVQMVAAAAALIAEKGFAQTRIADVAARVGTSPALVVYYFSTKDDLLVEALRWSESTFYDAAEELLEKPGTLAERLEALVDFSFTPDSGAPLGGGWAIYFDLWVQALRHPKVSVFRRELDEQWRKLIERVVRAGIEAGEIGEVDVESFAIGWGAMVDGLSVQVALEDPSADLDRVKQILLDFARRQLGIG